MATNRIDPGAGTSPDERERAHHDRPARPAPPVAHPPDRPEASAGKIDRRALIVAGAATGVSATAASLGLARAQDATPAAAPSTAAGAATPAAAGQHETGAQAATGAAQGGFAYFVPFQAAIVQAAAARLIPTDDLGPGATEAGVVFFIDRQLYAERLPTNGYRGWRYAQGPFAAGEATQGDQSALAMSERFRLGIFGMENFSQSRYGKGFAELPPDRQDEVLRAMDAGQAEPFGGASIVAPPGDAAPDHAAPQPDAQAGIAGKAFFELLLTYTVAGFFADPVHGGNRDMLGWKLIGFPGAQMGYADWILRYGEAFDGPYLSIADHQTMTSEGA